MSGRNLDRKTPKKIKVRYIESENNGAIEVFVNMVKTDLLKPITDKEIDATLEPALRSQYNKVEGLTCQK